MILGFDPGRDKCGVAVMADNGEVVYHEVILSTEAISMMESLLEKFPIQLIVLGNQTTSKSWQEKIRWKMPSIPIEMVDERNSTLEARDLYWEKYPPKGLLGLIPQGMRLPPRPIDDLVAILLIQRYLENKKNRS